MSSETLSNTDEVKATGKAPGRLGHDPLADLETGDGGPPVAPEEDADLTVTLGETLSIAEAQATLDGVLPRLDGARGIVFDASALERVDTAGLQLLLALTREARERGQPVRWNEPTEVLRSVARIVDLDGHLGLAAEA